MDLVIDANILFAAFIKNSTTRKLLLTMTPMPLKLYTTPFILEETYKYKKLLAKKAGIDETDVMELILELISMANIEIVKEEALHKFEAGAKAICPTENDVPYFAVALYKRCSIWSNDKPLKKQSRIEVITTKELLESL